MSIGRKRVVRKSFRTSLIMILIVLLTVPSLAGFSQRYTANTMRLLRYEGTVEILDRKGNSRALMENAKFNSGETMATGEESLASVGLDDSKIVTLDENSRVEFEKKKNKINLLLSEGTLFCDVREKLKDNESLDIRTSTMVIGIRGTYVVVTADSAADRLIVLEGTAEVTWKDPGTGEERVTSVSAGRVFAYGTDLDTAGSEVLANKDNIYVLLTDVSLELLPELLFRETLRDETVRERTLPVMVGAVLNGTGPDFQKLTGTKGQFVRERTIVLRAGSAEKVYDGTPLTAADYEAQCPDGLLVRAVTDGTLTDVGETQNGFASYAVYDTDNTDVTDRYLIRTEPGVLSVFPAELTVQTGTAFKNYDGTPLSNPEAVLTGLVNGETAEVRAVGILRYIGTVENGYEITWGTAKPQNYVITEKLGQLSMGNPRPNATDPGNGGQGQVQPTPYEPYNKVEPTPQTLLGSTP